MIVYKLARKNPYTSGWRSYGCVFHPYNVTYEIGKTTVPYGDSWLYAFSTCEACLDVLDYGPNINILECQASHVVEPGDAIGAHGIYEMGAFWQGLQLFKTVPKSKYPGTVWCTDITPIRVVE